MNKNNTVVNNIVRIYKLGAKMFFIGIVTNHKNESYLKKELAKFMPLENIIFLNEKNICNMKNVKFETVIIDEKIRNNKEIRKIISSSKYLLINVDIDIDKSIIDNLNLMAITYGFNNKSTFTISSIEENSVIICLQRVIFDINGYEIEPQEYEVKIHENTDKYAIIVIEILKIIYYKNNLKI